MRKPYVLANALLWAAAMLAAAVLRAPVFLTIVLLPMLATLSTLAAGRDACLNRSELS
ncbi:hypothetical protein [Dyella agri]|uniref:Uncharacterized protein n=1 Tax=Dyella agri TaxID=1926869 RepID=A0ABW8KEB0_9GAMM